MISVTESAWHSVPHTHSDALLGPSVLMAPGPANFEFLVSIGFGANISEFTRRFISEPTR